MKYSANGKQLGCNRLASQPTAIAAGESRLFQDVFQSPHRFTLFQERLQSFMERQLGFLRGIAKAGDIQIGAKRNVYVFLEKHLNP
jgi:hypothetical protein